MAGLGWGGVFFMSRVWVGEQSGEEKEERTPGRNS